MTACGRPVGWRSTPVPVRPSRPVHGADPALRQDRRQMVSTLSLGGMFDIPNNQLLLRQALKWGVTYWDTANSYEGGNSELGIGKYFAKYPEDRKNIFLVTKSTAWTLKGMTDHLNLSLERMQTDHVDLFFVHAIRSIATMDKDKQRWGEKAKADGKIRLFGFSTHSNMEECLLGGRRAWAGSTGS
ncbi:MAG: aldo/keto reductase [Deltaproteobacteria bacterium]|nr:aldo/keto reductase [Deltaproteobacteria bacterium]